MAKVLRVLIPSAALAAMALGAGFYVFTNSIGSYVTGSVVHVNGGPIHVDRGDQDRAVGLHTRKDLRERGHIRPVG